MNDLYRMMGGGNLSGLARQFMAFKQNFQGDPRAQVQALLQSGKVSQEQYDEAVKRATELRKLLNM